MNPSLLNNRQGQGLTEYLILVMIVAVASITIVQGFGGKIRAKISEATDTIEDRVNVSGNSTGKRR